MKKLALLAVALLAFYGCSSDDSSSEPAAPEPITLNWSLSGTFGNVSVDAANADTELPGMVKRSGESTLHLDGFDTAYFERKISLRHLQISAGAEVEINDEGYFTFNNLEVFGLCENTNSIKIMPRPKENVNLNPSSIILYSYR